MLGRLKFLLAFFLYWVVLFECARLVFLLYHYSQTGSLSFQTSLLTFVYGLRMDLSMAAYILAPVCLFVLAGVWIPFFRKHILYSAYTCVLLFFVLLIVIADLQVYSQWGFRMDATPLKYLASPAEAWASVSHLPVFWILLSFLLVYVLLCFVTIRFMKRISAFQQDVKPKVFTFFAVAAFTAFLIIPIRGGIQLSPINQSSVYFSSQNFANLAAINASWNFLHGVMNETGSSENPYVQLDWNKARHIIDSLYQSAGDTASLLTATRPNIILVIWESFTEKATHVNIDGKEVTPRFNELKKEGIYFSNAYASGDRTDKGISGILSGYPALHKNSIIRVPNKSAKLPVLAKSLQQKGYAVPFYYGGETEFANIRSYILNGGFSPVIDKNEFPAKDQNSKWGAHDGVVAERILKDVHNLQQPFMVTWLTLTSHEPYETPVPIVFHGDDYTTRFMNAMHYTDAVLYDFVNQCRRQAWWQNTLLVVIADHGHHLPDNGNGIDNFRIPLLLLGGALKQKGVTLDRVASQTDLVQTLEWQTGGQTKYPFSRGLFDTTSRSWAFFTFNNGFGFIQPGKRLLFDNVGQKLMTREGNISPMDVEAGQALQQVIFQDYLDK